LTPNNSILEAFNLHGTAHPLPGGQNTSWKIDHFILKYVGPGDNHEWIAFTLGQLKPNGYRISKPVVSQNKTFVYKGWTCSEFAAGTFMKGYEKQKLEASRLFHQSLVSTNTSEYQPGNDRWQKAHRIAWLIDTIPDDLNRDDVEYISGLLKLVRDSHNYDVQLVHGDLSGNTLFHETLDPLIIDFSPTLAPVEYAEAILVVDSIAWFDAPLSTLELLPNNEMYRDMLFRATIFRLSVAALKQPNNFRQTLNDLRPIINELLR
jgi:uncharacterized protein (TIGR02569 family)